VRLNPAALGPLTAPAPAPEVSTRSRRTSREATARESRPPSSDREAGDARDSGALQQAQAASELAIEIRLARDAGVPDTEIFEVTAAFDPDGDLAANRRVIETLRKARLTALGYDVTMRGDEYGRLRAIAALMDTPGGTLTDGDIQWLRDRLAADPDYLDRLPRRGMAAPATGDGDQPANGFMPGLDASQAETVSTLLAP
jgi:hypothetical protein